METKFQNLSLNDSHIGWKTARYAEKVIQMPQGISPIWTARDVLLELRIFGQNNESRPLHPENVKFAFHRAESVLVEKVYTLSGSELTPSMNTVFSVHDASFFYNLNVQIHCKKRFDDELEKVYASGIHYFLDRDTAIEYVLGKRTRDENGVISTKN